MVSYKMGNFYKKMFFFFKYSLLGKIGKIPLKTGPKGDGHLRGLCFCKGLRRTTFK